MLLIVAVGLLASAALISACTGLGMNSPHRSADQPGRVETVDLAQILLRVTTVIGDRSVGGIPNVPGTGVSVIGLSAA
jgi:hypothetical protein